jgi:hypothetical protein
MRVWAAAALAGWIALWAMVYRGRRHREKAPPELSKTASCLAVESDVEGAARSTPELDRDNRDGNH